MTRARAHSLTQSAHCAGANSSGCTRASASVRVRSLVPVHEGNVAESTVKPDGHRERGIVDVY